MASYENKIHILAALTRFMKHPFPYSSLQATLPENNSMQQL
jgi:hypothetical protein